MGLCSDPEAQLFPGKPTGSAMPLAWAHAEFIQLAVSRDMGRPVDRPAAVQQRYRGRWRKSSCAFSFAHAPIAHLPSDCTLNIMLPRASTIHWGADDWQNAVDELTRDMGLGLQGIELTTARLGRASSVVFTWRWRDEGTWIGRDLTVNRWSG